MKVVKYLPTFFRNVLSHVFSKARVYLVEKCRGSLLKKWLITGRPPVALGMCNLISLKIETLKKPLETLK